MTTIKRSAEIEKKNYKGYAETYWKKKRHSAANSS